VVDQTEVNQEEEIVQKYLIMRM